MCAVLLIDVCEDSYFSKNNFFGLFSAATCAHSVNIMDESWITSPLWADLM